MEYSKGVDKSPQELVEFFYNAYAAADLHPLVWFIKAASFASSCPFVCSGDVPRLTYCIPATEKGEHCLRIVMYQGALIIRHNSEMEDKKPI